MNTWIDLATMLNLCIDEREELRELNAELLAMVKKLRDESAHFSLFTEDADEVIAKAEALK